MFNSLRPLCVLCVSAVNRSFHTLNRNSLYSSSHSDATKDSPPQAQRTQRGHREFNCFLCVSSVSAVVNLVSESHSS